MTRAALKIAALIAAALLALAGFNHLAGFIPFTPQYAAKRAAVKVENLEGQVSSLERTATGNAEIATATETYHTREVVIREATASAISDARSDPDAETPIPADRASRFNAHYRGVCDAAPDVCPAPDAP